MGDGGSDEAAGNDYARNVKVEAYSFGDYGPPKEEPELKFAATGSADGDGDASAHAGIGDYLPPKEEPKSEFVDIYYHSVKVEPKLELASTDGSEDCDSLIDEPDMVVAFTDNADECYHDCDPLKVEPGPDLAAMGDDAVTDGGRDVGYECSHCGISLCTQEFKLEHELRFKAQMQRREFESKITEMFHCAYCRCTFPSKEYQEQHQQKWCRKRPVPMRKDSSGTYFKCAKCEYSTKRKDHLERHRLSHNKDDAEWLTCTQCSFKTVHKRSMTRHIKIHTNHDDNTFSCCCPVCGRSFRAKSCLDDHLLKQHFDEWDDVSKLITTKIYTCNICDKYRTAVKAAFNRHVSITHHKGVGCQKYECHLCPYSTFVKGNLKRHSKMHFQEKRYQCTVCKKQFIQKQALDSHILFYHSDNMDLVKTITAKIHCCKTCSFKAVRVTDLKRHEQLKHI